MVRPKKTDKPAREKILETAMDLFYRQGYHQTGINQIIEESGVSKATFYAHYPTKEDLSLEHLRQRISNDYQEISKAIEGYEDPHERFMSFVTFMEPFMLDSDYRGCTFANLAAELTDPQNPMVDLIRRHDEMYLNLIRKTTRELLESDPERYGHLDVDEVAETYYVIIEGAIAAAKNQRSIWPVKRAIAYAQKLLD